MNKLQQTTNKAFPIIPRLIAGGILTFFSLKHFSDPGHFANIMTAAGFPMVDLNVWAASATELIAGILLLSGLFTRVGGFLGIATMVPAVIAALTIAGLDPENLPGGLTEVPFVPPHARCCERGPGRPGPYLNSLCYPAISCPKAMAQRKPGISETT